MWIIWSHIQLKQKQKLKKIKAYKCFNLYLFNMGIPYLFYNIVRNNSHVLRQPSQKPDRFFLDFNSIIHQCSASVVGSLTSSILSSVLQEKIFKSITDYLMNVLIPLSHPKHVMYIAIDGVAPLAKIQQQRKRRYMTAYRNELIKQFNCLYLYPITLQ